jgi:hypothetical protein
METMLKPKSNSVSCCVSLVSKSTKKAYASHFRYMSLYWSRPSASSRVVTFIIEQAWRADYGPFGGNTDVNNVVNTGTFFFGDGNSAAVNVVRILCFLCRTVSSHRVLSLFLLVDGQLVSELNKVENWFVGSTSFTNTYATTAGNNPLGYFYDCCRIS